MVDVQWPVGQGLGGGGSVGVLSVRQGRLSLAPGSHIRNCCKPLVTSQLWASPSPATPGPPSPTSTCPCHWAVVQAEGCSWSERWQGPGPRALRSFCLMWALPDPCLQTKQTWGWGGCWGLSRGLLQSRVHLAAAGWGPRSLRLNPRPKEAGLPCSSLMPARPCVLGVQLLELGSTLRPPRPPQSLQRPPGEAGFPGVAGDPLPPPSPAPPPPLPTTPNCPLPVPRLCSTKTPGSQLVSVRSSRTPLKQKALNVKKGARRPHLGALS